MARGRAGGRSPRSQGGAGRLPRPPPSRQDRPTAASPHLHPLVPVPIRKTSAKEAHLSARFHDDGNQIPETKARQEPARLWGRLPASRAPFPGRGTQSSWKRGCWGEAELTPLWPLDTPPGSYHSPGAASRCGRRCVGGTVEDTRTETLRREALGRRGLNPAPPPPAPDSCSGLLHLF